MSTNRPTIIVDGLNIFLRSYLVNQEVNTRSELVGGVVGFLKFINSLTYKFSPGKIIVVWEAGGPCSRRKAIDKNYKQNRSKIKPTNSNAFKDVLYNDTETKVNQLSMLSKLLSNTPVYQVFVKDTECDDIVAYISNTKLRNEGQKIITSSDKDFYQLLEDKSVVVYNPASKAFVKAGDVKDRFGIAPRNFCLARAIIGDPSDNLGGIQGAGFKTIAKRFPFLSEEDTDYTIQDIIEHSKKQIEDKSKIKLYQRIAENEELIRKNWKLMYLSVSTLSATQINKVNYVLDDSELIMNRAGLIQEAIKAGLNVSFNFDNFSNQLKNNLLFS